APERVRPALRHVDRRVVGGAAVAVAFMVLLAAALLVGWIFDTIDTSRGFAQWDESAAEWGATNATETSTDVLTLFTQFGATRYVLPLMLIVGLVDVARHRNWNVVGYLAAAGIGIVLLNNGLKLLVDRERPDIARLVGHAGSSFPSGHSAAAAACWAALALVAFRHFHRRSRIAAFAGAVAIALVVAVSRVLLGVHWLTDVIAGVVVGWTWFFLVSILFGGRLVKLGEPAERVAEGRLTPEPLELEHS
ncbi:MAG TPA: phosphatase PAP2 family protein, partial [Ilumatobacteraceae bacterium]